MVWICNVAAARKLVAHSTFNEWMGWPCWRWVWKFPLAIMISWTFKNVRFWMLFLFLWCHMTKVFPKKFVHSVLQSIGIDRAGQLQRGVLCLVCNLQFNSLSGMGNVRLTTEFIGHFCSWWQWLKRQQWDCQNCRLQPLQPDCWGRNLVSSGLQKFLSGEVNLTEVQLEVKQISKACVCDSLTRLGFTFLLLLVCKKGQPKCVSLFAEKQNKHVFSRPLAWCIQNCCHCLTALMHHRWSIPFLHLVNILVAHFWTDLHTAVGFGNWDVFSCWGFWKLRCLFPVKASLLSGSCGSWRHC